MASPNYHAFQFTFFLVCVFFYFIWKTCLFGIFLPFVFQILFQSSCFQHLVSNFLFQSSCILNNPWNIYIIYIYKLVGGFWTHLKKYETKWKSSPIFGVKIRKIFELPPPSKCEMSLLTPTPYQTFKTSPRSALVIGWRWKDQWCHQGRYPGGEVWHSAMVKCKDGYPDPKLLTKVSPENGETPGWNIRWTKLGNQASSFSGEQCSSSGVYGRQRNARNDRFHVVLFWWAGALFVEVGPKLVAWKVTIVCYFVISWLHSRWSSLPISQQRFNCMHLACVVDHFPCYTGMLLTFVRGAR